MSRRIAMWVAVTSLAALGGVTATSAVYISSSRDTGWTFYTPYSVTTSPPPANVLDLCTLAQRILLPVAAIASALYLYLADRDVRRLLMSRGLGVQVGPQSDDASPLS